MGKSSKPLHIQLDRPLYESNEAHWQALVEQGYVIQVIEAPAPDLYLASHAMRFTGDMLKQLPASFDLAVKGARTLRYSTPSGKEWRSAKTKVTRQRKHTKVKVEAAGTGELPPQVED